MIHARITNQLDTGSFINIFYLKEFYSIYKNYTQSFVMTFCHYYR